MGFLSKRSEELLSVLRIITAFLFIQHGTQKLFSFPIDARGAYDLWTLSPGAAALIEVILGPLMLVGLFTRVNAFVLSGFSAFAYFIAHAPRGFFPIGNGGESAVLYCFVFLYIAAAGGGKWSIDALRSR